ncbi:NADH dehydrogenase [ubiquinone] 1 alpha subcomplex subunit 3-like [Podarcis raffonei]|uniref:NADH dehydrogenase [ubiquinone] 1 alpha subcomplex subunit 3-like n=1 Tax=Podarcis raffonei TaxID=65483 RepID=UPI0023294891|nr:NADH dehydrogenase [ubiquinone] 1 alpha subcomplex subunit 3-like [Podarcis raffonei]
MAALSKIIPFLKNAWGKDPVVVLSFGIGFMALVAPWVSPLTKYSTMMNQAVPYPVPVWDGGNMPDIPSLPCDKEGPSLEWLKNF